MPTGESRPWGEVTLTTSPTSTARLLARSRPSSMGGMTAAPSRSASMRPRSTWLAISVTLRSSSGSMPFTVATADPAALLTSALP